MLEALDRSGLQGIVTRANDDPGGAAVNATLETFCGARPHRFRLFAHLGSLAFHSALQHLDVLVGNSSSGIIEAPSFGIPVVNIGDRQQGRVRAGNVLDCGYGADGILAALRKATSPEFRRSLAGLKNPYDEFGDGRSAWRIKERLKRVSIDSAVLKKPFFDAPLEGVT
jgi:UDP-N-acetylglucosamine 2-epimerase (non-hydrolysing)/GDP/UDP-N,N'-diacetylbacillosamine 2-epimerase (hydrolysing)